jgi:hypothetical protein
MLKPTVGGMFDVSSLSWPLKEFEDKHTHKIASTPLFFRHYRAQASEVESPSPVS